MDQLARTGYYLLIQGAACSEGVHDERQGHPQSRARQSDDAIDECCVRVVELQVSLQCVDLLGDDASS